MKIKINCNEKELNQDSVTIEELLKLEKVDNPEMVSVEFNGEILDREAFATTKVKDGGAVEFLYFMGGGAKSKCHPREGGEPNGVVRTKKKRTPRGEGYAV